jgi:hypothetical protein
LPGDTARRFLLPRVPKARARCIARPSCAIAFSTAPK